MSKTVEQRLIDAETEVFQSRLEIARLGILSEQRQQHALDLEKTCAELQEKLYLAQYRIRELGGTE